MSSQEFMREAIAQSALGVQSGQGEPFGTVIVKDGRIVARGHNQVPSANDPTAHAEIVAIRAACRTLNTFRLEGCELYTSCEPCPMCLGAIYWAQIDRVFYASSQEDAAAVGFDDQFIYDEIARPVSERRVPMKQLLREEALTVLQDWSTNQNT